MTSTKFSRDQLISRVKAILAKTEEGSNATPAEIVEANRKATELMGKYNIELADLLTEDVNDSSLYQFVRKYVDQHQTVVYSKMLEFRVELMYTVAKVNSCKMLMNRSRFILLGREDQVEIAAQMYYSLQNQLETAVEKVVRALSADGQISSRFVGRYNTGVYRRSWLDGAVTTIRRRLIDDWQASQVATSTNALIVLTDQKLSEFQNELYPKISTRSFGNDTMSNFGAYASGAVAGQSIHAMGGLNGSSSSRKELK